MFDKLTPVRRRLAATSLLAFVALLLAQDAVDPTDQAESNADRLAAAVDQPDRLLAATVLLVLSSAVLLPAIAAILESARERIFA